MSMSSGPLSEGTQSHTACQALGQPVPDTLGIPGQPVPAHSHSEVPAVGREQPRTTSTRRGAGDPGMNRLLPPAPTSEGDIHAWVYQVIWKDAAGSATPGDRR